MEKNRDTSRKWIGRKWAGNRARSSLRLALPLLAIACILGCNQKSQPLSNQPASPQGDTWDSIKKLPDWSGVWVLNFSGGGREAGEDALNSENRCGDRGTDCGRVPLTPKYREIRAAAHAANAQQDMSRCLPAGTPGILQHGVLHEYLFTPGRVTVLIENGEVRRIYTDGRLHKSLDELSESYEGDSIGHWEGNTLVVDTIGFPKGALWKDHGVTATKNTHLVERIFRNDRGQIEIDSTMTDPQIFAQPYVYQRRYDPSKITMGEPACEQNNRDRGDSVDLTPPPEE